MVRRRTGKAEQDYLAILEQEKALNTRRHELTKTMTVKVEAEEEVTIGNVIHDQGIQVEVVVPTIDNQPDEKQALPVPTPKRKAITPTKSKRKSPKTKRRKSSVFDGLTGDFKEDARSIIRQTPKRKTKAIVQELREEKKRGIVERAERRAGKKAEEKARGKKEEVRVKGEEGMNATPSKRKASATEKKTEEDETKPKAKRVRKTKSKSPKRRKSSVFDGLTGSDKEEAGTIVRRTPGRSAKARA
jgi:hypothetical protein